MSSTSWISLASGLGAQRCSCAALFLGGMHGVSLWSFSSSPRTNENENVAILPQIESNRPRRVKLTQIPEVKPKRNIRQWHRRLALGAVALAGALVGGSLVFLVGNQLLKDNRSAPRKIEAANPQAKAKPSFPTPLEVTPRIVVLPVAKPPVARADPVETIPAVIAPPATVTTSEKVARIESPDPLPEGETEARQVAEQELAALIPEPRPDTAAVRPTPPATQPATQPAPKPVVAATEPTPKPVTAPIEPTPEPVVAATEPQDLAATPRAQEAPVEVAVATIPEPEVVAPPESQLPARRELPLARAQALMADLFDNLYGADQIQSMTLYALEDEVETPIEMLKLARKRIGERIHTLGILAGAGQLPEIRILSIESGENREERFAYLPGERKALRLSGAGALDPFAGTHFSYEDFRPRSPDSYTVAKLEQSTLGGEAVYIITAIPRYDADYHQVEFFLAWEDRSILERRYFRAGLEQPYRLIQYPREHMQTVEGSVLPTQAIVKDLDHGTTALARIKYDLSADILDDALFTLSSFRAPDLEIPSPW